MTINGENHLTLRQEISQTGWYYAVDYLDESQFQNAYQQLLLTTNGTGLSCRNFVISQLLRILVIYADTPPGKNQVERIKSICTAGHPIALPESVLEELFQRRREGRDQTLYSGGEYIGHDASGQRGLTRSEFPRELYEEHLSKLLSTSGYFIDLYEHILAYNFRLRLSSPNGAAYVQAYRELLAQAEIYDFTETARRMHKAVYEDDDRWIDWQQNLWIEHDEPYELFRGQPIRALFVNKSLQDEAFPEYNSAFWTITAIDPLGRHSLTLFYDDRKQTYHPTAEYPCPTKECRDTTEEIVEETRGLRRNVIARFPCKTCIARTEILAKWLHTAMRQIRRDFALSANPEPFPTGEQIRRERILVPRHHGSGKPKEKSIEKRRPYTIISYDVSVSESRGGEPTEPISEEEKSRVNWLTLHGKEHRIYELLAVPTHDRSYRGPYWHRLITRCLQEVERGRSGVVTLDDINYQVHIADDGEVTVKRRVEFKKGRWTPRLKPEYKEQLTRKRTTARLFVELSEEEEGR